MKEKNDFLLKKEHELVELVKKNEEQINKLGAQGQVIVEGGKGEPEIQRIELWKAKIEVREKSIFYDRHVYKIMDQDRIAVLDRERQLIKQQFDKLYKKQVQDLEANILAYQDLLMAKEIEMQRMQKELIESAGKETTIL